MKLQVALNSTTVIRFSCTSKSSKKQYFLLEFLVRHTLYVPIIYTKTFFNRAAIVHCVNLHYSRSHTKYRRYKQHPENI